MNKIIQIKNTGVGNTWCGQYINTDEYYLIPTANITKWNADDIVFSDINAGTLVVNNGATDLDKINGWKWLNITDLPISDLDGLKLAVHSSAKPIVSGITTYVVWGGSGDNVITGVICDGDLLEFNMVPGVSTQSIDVKFNHIDHGRVWIHEGYVRFENGGSGDNMNGEVYAEATPLQQSVNLDLILTNNMITYSPGGPGTGTHGFADPTKIVLIPRTHSNDGDWDWDQITLTPNFTNTGGFKLSNVETVIHRYINKIPCRGTCPTYFSMTSDETTEILTNYFLRITANNVSDTTWYSTVILEIYRERTFNP